VISLFKKTCFVYSTKKEIPQKKPRKVNESQELPSLSRKRLQQPQNEFEKMVSA
jgi:hypothetical protein